MQFSKGTPRPVADDEVEIKGVEESPIEEEDDLDEEEAGLVDTPAEDEEGAAEEEKADTDETTEENPATSPESASPEAVPELVFSMLIRCAEARGDETAAAAYKEEYELAKEQALEQQAKEIIRNIEAGVRAGTVFSSEGLTLSNMSEEIFTRLAKLFGSEQENSAISIKLPGKEDKALIVTLEGVAKLR